MRCRKCRQKKTSDSPSRRIFRNLATFHPPLLHPLSRCVHSLCHKSLGIFPPTADGLEADDMLNLCRFGAWTRISSRQRVRSWPASRERCARPPGTAPWNIYYMKHRTLDSCRSRLDAPMASWLLRRTAQPPVVAFLPTPRIPAWPRLETRSNSAGRLRAGWQSHRPNRSTSSSGSCCC